MQLVRSSRRIYDANAVLKLFFFWQILGRKEGTKTGRATTRTKDEKRKGNDQGKRVGLFLGYCDQMDLLR